MSALQTLDAARAARVDIQLDGNDLILTPADELPADLLAELRRHKLSIVVLLQQDRRQKEQPIPPWGQAEYECLFNERAAIAECDGELRRAEAEARAFACCVSQWLFFNPTSSSPDRCLECGSAARVNDPLLAVGIVHPDSLSWLHCECVPAWHASRIAAAVAALAAMNISAASDASQPPVPEPTEAKAITVFDQEMGPTTGEN
jgi:hypothetical protein